MDDRDIVSYNHADALLTYLQQLLSQGQFCDVTINLDGQFVSRCHRLILAAMSSNLESLFIGVDDSPTLTVDIESKLTGVQFDDLKNSLDYFYHGRILFTRTLYQCASALGCDSLLSLISGRDSTGDIIDDPNHANRLLIEIRRLYLEGRFADCSLSVQGYTTQPNVCHRIVLCAFSQHLETALQRTENSANVTLEIDPTSTGVSNTDLRTIVDFMYYGMLRVIKRKIKSLLYASKALNVYKMLEMLTVGDTTRAVSSYSTRPNSTFVGLNLASFDMHQVASNEDVGGSSDAQREVEMGLSLLGDERSLAKEDDYMELYEEYVSGPRRGRKGGTYGPRRDHFMPIKPLTKEVKHVQPKCDGLMFGGVVVDDSVAISTEVSTHPSQSAVTMSVVSGSKRRRVTDSYGYGLPELVGANAVTVPLMVGDQRMMMEKPFKCPYCDHRTKEKSAIEKHIRCIHTLEAPYKCTYCNQAFKVQSNLVRHIRAHTGEKPYVCKKCGAAYADKKNMDAHVFREHLKMIPLQCPAPGCNAKFWRQDRYDFHCKKSHNFDPPPNPM